MDPKQVVVVAVAFLVLIAIVWMFARKQRTIKLKERFGPEYDRVVRESGPQLAEANLLEREKRVRKFSMRELPAEERESLVTDWRLVQAHFVDNPQEAVSQADLLVDRVMQARGYPVAEFEQQAADISVHHPKVVDNYRAAHLIAARHRQGQASTEDLRTAIIYYRSLFDELLGHGPKLHTREVA